MSDTMLTGRQATVLELVIGEYVETATPIGSQHIRTKYKMNVSSATIRNDMAELEEQGYLSHPHTSSGRVPTELGYRCYVESLMREEQLPWEAQQTIRHQFHQVERGQEAWAHLAASVLSHAVENAAVVTAPWTDVCRLKHIELVSLQERSALLVIVLDQARLKQHVLALDEDTTQDQLGQASARLNAAFEGLTAHDIEARAEEFDGVAFVVIGELLSVMRAIDVGSSDEAYLDGLRHVLGQPEFTNSQRALALLELLDERNLTRAIPFRQLAQEGITVIIGADNPRLSDAGEAMRACSVIVTSYGDPGGASGALAVLGPMRMRYPRTISTVRYLAAVMSELMGQYAE
jgi:heat-inducible transcriptional repressor